MSVAARDTASASSAPLRLASRSPRRAALLEQHGVPFLTAPSNIDDGELRPGSGSAEAWVTALAYLKARAALDKLGATTDRVVALGADTIVVKRRRLIGQPADAAHARRIISALRDGSHAVVTGVALLDRATGVRTLFVDSARVEVGSISDDAIESYLESGGWRGKAGAYNLEERIADGWPIHYDGDPTTIMGLPMRKLVIILESMGVIDHCGETNA